MNLFPFFEDIEGKIFLIAGGGRVAERKTRVLLGFGADVLVIAPQTAMEGKRLKYCPYMAADVGWGEPVSRKKTDEPDYDS